MIYHPLFFLQLLFISAGEETEFIGNGVIPSRAERVAAQNPLHSQIAALDGTEPSYRTEPVC